MELTPVHTSINVQVAVKQGAKVSHYELEIPCFHLTFNQYPLALRPEQTVTSQLLARRNGNSTQCDQQTRFTFQVP
jgi:hypothetical protein